MGSHTSQGGHDNKTTKLVPAVGLQKENQTLKHPPMFLLDPLADHLAAKLVLPLVQAIAIAIPLVGAPIQAAIGGSLSCLQAIDRHHQNKAGLVSLTLRLNRLSCNLCNAPPARNPSEQSWRDSFVRMLQDTSVRVAALHERRLASTPVTQAIADCFVEIDRYLADFLFSSLLRNQDDLYNIREDVATLRRQREDDQKLLIAS